jgi:hypothetical protein
MQLLRVEGALRFDLRDIKAIGPISSVGSAVYDEEEPLFGKK